jgi:hypothetical protein
VVDARCPVVTVNGPAPIVGEDYDKIVVGWTEGHTGRRALEAAAEEAALRGSLVSVVTITPSAGGSPPRSPARMDLEQALIDSISRIECAHPGLRIDVIHRSGDVAAEIGTILAEGSPARFGLLSQRAVVEHSAGPIPEELMRP